MLRTRFDLPRPEEAGTLAALLGGEAVGTVPDPGRLVAAAGYHALAPQLRAAADEGRADLGARGRAQIDDLVAKRAVETALVRRRLPGLVATLQRACGAAPVLIKGPAVGDRFYPGGVPRFYADLDLMVPRERLARAVEAVGADGWSPLLEFREGYALAHGHDVHVKREEGRRAVHAELHWRVGDDPAASCVDHGFVSTGAEALAAEGAEVLVPSPSRQLLVLSVHLLSDRSRRLGWVYDIALVARACTDAQWREAFALASEHRLGWVLHRALDYARHHLGFQRARPQPAGPPPPLGPIRAVEALDARAAPHFGRLASTRGRARLAYLRSVLVPTRVGLEGTVGGDGAPAWRLAARHARRVVASVAPRRK